MSGGLGSGLGVSIRAALHRFCISRFIISLFLFVKNLLQNYSTRCFRKSAQAIWVQGQRANAGVSTPRAARSIACSPQNNRSSDLFVKGDPFAKCCTKIYVGHRKSACLMWKATWWGDSNTFLPFFTTFNSSITKSPWLNARRQSGMPNPTRDSIRVIWQFKRFSFRRWYRFASGFDAIVFLFFRFHFRLRF